MGAAVREWEAGKGIGGDGGAVEVASWIDLLLLLMLIHMAQGRALRSCS